MRSLIRGALRPSALLGMLTTVAFVVGCSSGAEAPEVGEPWLDAHGLAGLDGKEVVEQLDEMPLDERPGDLMASVQADAVELSDAVGEQASLDLPADEFYLSIAPYVDQTHDCFLHSLTTCVGEMQNEDVHITVTGADGAVLVDEETTTFDNGFLGLWLPADIEGELTIEADGMSASTPIATNEDDPTCLTTLQLT